MNTHSNKYHIHFKSHMADPESQMTPLAPAVVKSDEIAYTATAKLHKSKHQKSSKFLVYVLAVIVSLGTIFLIISSVFLRVINPKLRITSVSIQNLQYDNANSTSSPLNITMLTDVTVINRNFGSYEFEHCNAVVLGRIGTTGGGTISGGLVGGRTSKSMSTVIRIRSENLNVSNGDRTDVMEIRNYALMTGRVRVWKIVNRRKTIEMNCTVNVNLISRLVIDTLCA
ncbi:late embryogenesis abundant protein At1g64065-like [Rutidosis leptorrhynchoides]|uniref:late embryogenesis abundant protein At1g64065-like n=1 Tax=Rutidosis leptorrhynchoides TaxID=125765 RepID=UPI003A9A157F